MCLALVHHTRGGFASAIRRAVLRCAVLLCHCWMHAEDHCSCSSRASRLAWALALWACCERTPLHLAPFVQAYNYETKKLAVLSQEDSAIWVSGCTVLNSIERLSCSSLVSIAQLAGFICDRGAVLRR